MRAYNSRACRMPPTSGNTLDSSISVLVSFPAASANKDMTSFTENGDRMTLAVFLLVSTDCVKGKKQYLNMHGFK